MPLKSSASFETINADLALSLMRLQQSVEEIEAKGRAFLDAIGVLLAIDNPGQGGPNQQDEELPPVIITSSNPINLRNQPTTIANNPLGTYSTASIYETEFAPESGTWYRAGDDGFMWYRVKLNGETGWVRGDLLRPDVTWHPQEAKFNLFDTDDEIKNISNAIDYLGFATPNPEDEGYDPVIQNQITDPRTGGKITVACGPITIALALNLRFGLQLTAQDVYNEADNLIGGFPDNEGLSTKDFIKLLNNLLQRYLPTSDHDREVTGYSIADPLAPESYIFEDFSVSAPNQDAQKTAEELAIWAIGQNVSQGNPTFILVAIDISKRGVISAVGEVAHWVEVLDIADGWTSTNSASQWLMIYNPYMSRVEYYHWSEIWGKMYEYAMQPRQSNPIVVYDPHND